MQNRLEEFQNIIGFHFKDTGLLINALTHSSYINENKNRENVIKDNERLEFFGDAIIEFYVSEYLFSNFQDTPEGDLTKLRASLVCEQSLAECSRQIDLGSFLNMGKGEEASGGRNRASVISDAFEALTAAIYLDSGRNAAEAFIREHLLSVLDHRTMFFDAKTRLQETVQQNGTNTLVYQIISEDGPSHDKTFTAAVFLDGEEIGRGTGRSKKNAQQEAAMEALNRLAAEGR